ncbi:hypothetical protein D3C75_675950 [compost metagenome]
MTDPVAAPSQYILFDLSGQDVAVTNFEIDPNGKLKTEWVILGKRLWSDEQTDAMLAQAFKFLFENIEKNPFEEDEPEVPEPEPDLNKPIWRTLINKIKELW